MFANTTLMLGLFLTFLFQRCVTFQKCHRVFAQSPKVCEDPFMLPSAQSVEDDLNDKRHLLQHFTLIKLTNFLKSLTRKQATRQFNADLLVCVTVWGGGEVDLHDHLKLGVVAAVLEGRVVVVTAEHVGLVVWEARAVESKVVPPFMVEVGFAHPVMSRESCSVGGEHDKSLLLFSDPSTQSKCNSWPLRQKIVFISGLWNPLLDL